MNTASYATDKPYVAAVRDLVRESGFTDVPLFQCDWSSNFTNNALEDLLWTVNFGTGANIDQQFKKLKDFVQGNSVDVREFWSGCSTIGDENMRRVLQKIMVQGNQGYARS